MLTIYELLGTGYKEYFGDPSDKLVDNNTFIGIEIELEEYKDIFSTDKFSNYWDFHRDGSLRPRDEGVEFVSKSANRYGLIGSEIISALDCFNEVINYNKTIENKIPSISDRCSVHIHINVGDLTINQLKSLLILYLILEKTLFNYCSKERYYNNYCIPLLCNFKFLKAIKKWNSKGISDRNFLLIHLREAVKKYDALNISSIYKKGTIEFRMHPGCYDHNRILEWINIILSLKIYAENPNKTWLNILSSVSGKGSMFFVKEIFGEELFKILNYKDLDRDVLDSIREVQMIYYNEDVDAAIIESGLVNALLF